MAIHKGVKGSIPIVVGPSDYLSSAIDASRFAHCPPQGAQIRHRAIRVREGMVKLGGRDQIGMPRLIDVKGNAIWPSWGAKIRHDAIAIEKGVGDLGTSAVGGS